MSHISHDVLLDVKNVTKKYGQKEVLKGISFQLHAGEIFALLGPNGAGKTTLSSIIATLHPLTSGDILFNGVSIYENMSSYRAHLGFCPQKPNLNASLTLEQNLRFAGRYYGMSEAAIEDRLRVLTMQLSLADYLPCKADILSGGYRQRFMIARCLMHNPKLVILDEPTVGLDPHVRRQLWTIIKELKREGVSVILTTHYLDEAEQLADRVCIIDRGLIKLIDTPKNLLADFKKSNLEEVFLALMHDEKEDNQNSQETV